MPLAPYRCDTLQSIDRAYRIGQTKPVVAFRLVAQGTIEELRYIRGIRKTGHSQLALENDLAPERVESYFSEDELKGVIKTDMEKLEYPHHGHRLNEMHDALKDRPEWLVTHLEKMLTMGNVAGGARGAEYYVPDTTTGLSI